MPLDDQALAAPALDAVALDALPIEDPVEEKPSSLPSLDELKKIQEQLLPDLESAFTGVEGCVGDICPDGAVGALLVSGYNTPMSKLLGFAIPVESIRSGAYQQTFSPSVVAMLGVLSAASWDP